MYRIAFTDRAKKQFQKLERKIQERISASLDRIKIRPFSFVEKLAGDPGYKLKVGKYRVLMDVEKNILLITVITSVKKNFYKNIRV